MSRAFVLDRTRANFGPSVFSPVLDGVAQDTHPLDLHFEDIARLHENGWLACRPNATGCSGDDHITGSRLIATLIISISAETLKMS